MKIYILQVNKKFQPKKQFFKYPPHSSYRGIEIVFYNWLINQKNILTDNPDEADFHYLPIFWANWHLLHDYGKIGSEKLEKELNQVTLNQQKTFTLYQHDHSPLENLKYIISLRAARERTNEIDIPLLCAEHKIFKKYRKKYLASFVGREWTHKVRAELFKIIKGNKKYFYRDCNLGAEFFVKKTMQSYCALCPRGNGSSSFRFFEAMQLGIVPVHIGDIDIRPFKKLINWDEMSFYFETPKEAIDTIEKTPKKQLVEMGIRAKEFWYNTFYTEKWCSYAIKELADLKDIDYTLPQFETVNYKKIDALNRFSYLKFNLTIFLLKLLKSATPFKKKRARLKEKIKELKGKIGE